MKHAFDKFIDQEKNSKKKEALRQEKRKWKKAEKERKYGDKPKTQDPSFTKKNSDFKRAEPSFKKQETKSGVHQSKKINTRFIKPDHREKIYSVAVDSSSKKQVSKTQIINHETLNAESSTEMPLNKFIAHAGICGRREAAELVKEGKIKVNNAIVTEPGFKVTSTDKIFFNGKQLHQQKNLVYILLNKPKDFITTAKDTHGRKTVFDIIQHATTERVFPVGRLDRNTTGVLLLTNDGELTQKLTHPSFEVKKIYEVKLDKPLLKKDMEKILEGIELEDGFIKADTIGYADIKDKKVIGIEIHSGRNRIVRRVFEYLGYDVKNLDRVLFGNLTKKNVDRGKWRFLNDKEIRLLKYMNQSFLKKV